MKWNLSVTPEGTDSTIIGTVYHVGYNGHYCAIVPDHAAGRRARYTVYRLPASPARRVRIVGRELTWAHAIKVAKATLLPGEGVDNG